MFSSILCPSSPLTRYRHYTFFASLLSFNARSCVYHYSLVTVCEFSFLAMGVGGVKVDYNKPPGFDRARNREVGKKDISLETMEEAFTSEHWIVRIYKVREGGTQ